VFGCIGDPMGWGDDGESDLGGGHDCSACPVKKQNVGGGESHGISGVFQTSFWSVNGVRVR